MAQEKKSIDDIQKIVDRIDLGKVLYDSPQFRLMEKGDGFLLQLTYYEPDTEDPSGVAVKQHARKWYVSPYSTETEIVRTAYKAVLTSLEHRLGEHFLYYGEKVYNPHFSIITLHTIAEEGATEERD